MGRTDRNKARKNLSGSGSFIETAKEVIHDPDSVTKENCFVGDQG